MNVGEGEVEDTGDTDCTVQSEPSLTRGQRRVNNTVSVPGSPGLTGIQSHTVITSITSLQSPPTLYHITDLSDQVHAIAKH